MTLRTLNYGNYGIFLILGNAGFCPSAVAPAESPLEMVSAQESSGQWPLVLGLLEGAKKLAPWMDVSRFFDSVFFLFLFGGGGGGGGWGGWACRPKN